MVLDSTLNDNISIFNTDEFDFKSKRQTLLCNAYVKYFVRKFMDYINERHKHIKKNIILF